MTLTVLKLACVFKPVILITMYVEPMALTESLPISQMLSSTGLSVEAIIDRDHTVVCVQMVMGQHCSLKVYLVPAAQNIDTYGF